MSEVSITFDEICESQLFEHKQRFVIWEDHENKIKELEAKLAEYESTLHSIADGEVAGFDIHWASEMACEALAKIKSSDKEKGRGVMSIVYKDCDFCSNCSTHTLERHVGIDGLCSPCRNEEAMEHEFDFWEGEE